MNVLLTLGRLSTGLDLARGLSAAGHRVFVADPHKTHVSRYSSAVTKSFRVTAPRINADAFRDELLSIVDRHEIGLVVPVSEESIHASRIVPHLPTGVRYFGPGFEPARILHDKLAFNQRCHELGLTAPASGALFSHEARALVERTETILKPRHASAGVGFKTIARGGTLPATVERASMVQERITGQEVTSFSVVTDGRVLSTAVYEGTVMLGSVAIGFRRIDDAPAVLRWVERFAARTGYTGFLSFDFIIDQANVPQVLECNARLTSGVHFLETTAVARALSGEDTTSPVPLRKTARFQHFWPTLGLTEKALITRNAFNQHFAALTSSTDVTWSRRDPMPFLTMNFCTAEILKLAWREKVSLGAATVADIEWREPRA